MDISEVQKAVSEFESKLKPVTAEEKAMAAGKEVAPKENVVLTPAGGGGESCVIPAFKGVVVALYPKYVGKGEVPDLVKDFIDTLPECEV